MRAPLAVAAAVLISSSVLAQQPESKPGMTPPRSPTYPTPAPVTKPGGTPPRPAPQTPAAETGVMQLARSYEQAFNKGDVKTIALLYTADALRITPAGQFLTGRAAIENSYVEAFGGPFKGARLSLQPGVTRPLTSDVALIEGTFEVTGAGAPVRGRYVNTAVRQGDAWKLASVVTVMEAGGPPK